MLCLVNQGWAQTDPSQNGFRKVEGRHIRLVTDLPPSRELDELVSCFDLAMEQWGTLFGVDASTSSNWKCTAYVMLDRGRFQRAGLIPNHIPEFPYGFQYGDQVWVSEQPSPYYRRHLLLHEGTHWFLWRKNRDTGPPWLMEGLAEWLATHRWYPAEQRLVMGIIPKTREEVSYWGRIKILHDQLAEGTAPSLEDVMRFDSTAHQRVEAYAWSWAAVLFFHNNPDTQAAFDALLRAQLRSGNTLTRSLYRRLQPKWPRIRAAWSVWVTEMDYGADPKRMVINFRECQPLQSSKTLRIAPDLGWQSSGLCVEAGTEIRIEAQGEFNLADDPVPWRSTPAGVTLEYYRGRPLGELLMLVAEPITSEPTGTDPIEIIPVGVGKRITVTRRGQIFFRVNEATGQLLDNRGSVQVTIGPT